MVCIRNWIGLPGQLVSSRQIYKFTANAYRATNHTNTARFKAEALNGPFPRSLDSWLLFVISFREA